MLSFSLVLAVAAGGSLSIDPKTENAQSGVQAVSVSFPALQSAKALDGRLLLLLSNDPSEKFAENHLLRVINQCQKLISDFLRLL